MEKVIFKKDEKTIIIPWSICQNFPEMKGLYKIDAEMIIFDEMVTEIIFDKCNIKEDMKFALSKDQKISFTRCNSYNSNLLYIIGGHVIMNHSNFNYTNLHVKDGKTVTLNLNQNNKFLEISLLTSEINITGDINSNFIYLSSDSLKMQNSNIHSTSININTSQLNMKNNMFDCVNDISLCYQNMNIKNTCFHIDSGLLHFSKVLSGNFLIPDSLNKEIIMSYDKPINLKSEEIFSEKNQAMVSLISILKGVSQKIEDKNSEEIQLISSKINDSANLRIEALEKQIELLEEEKSQLMENTHYNQMKVEELFQNRKIKSIGTKKR